MNRFASAAWPLRAAYVAVLAAAGLAILATITLAVALAGLHRLTSHLDPLKAPAWFWYYRADPSVRRWLGVGALASAALIALPVSAALSRLRRPLYEAPPAGPTKASSAAVACAPRRGCCWVVPPVRS